jgi:endonuclease/exonuclease/phosphatase (EEP) superfamily protein YafD
MKRWLPRLVVLLAYGYPAALAVVALLLRFVGERWWATAVGLYLPRMLFALPLPFVVIAILWSRRPKLLWTQLAAALIVLFPLMGLTVSWPTRPRAEAPTLRVLSLNVDSGFFGLDKIDQEIARYSPDIVAFEEVQLEAVNLPDLLEARYRSVVASGQFIVASRFPILEITDPQRVFYNGRLRTPHFMRYLIAGSFGPFALYVVHPVSPRHVFYELRGKNGLKREILSGRIFTGWAAPDISENYDLRAEQVRAASEMAAKETVPVVLVGDTNLPGLSRDFADSLGRFQDGFREAGFGFGYTYQTYRPWMRLDRILASEDLRFVRFELGCMKASDHACVVGDLQQKAP